MKAFIWWLRSTFCKHEWKDIAAGRIQRAWPKEHAGEDMGTFVTKECKRCGWRWHQQNTI